MCESLPWPIAWVLGRFNLKHRHVYKPPLAERVRDQCIDLERKLLWRWHRDNKGFLDGEAPWRISDVPVAEYPKLPTPELRFWLSNLRQAVMGAFRRVKNAYDRGVGMRNMIGITRLGFKMLRESELCAMPCDKEGLFCTMPTTVPVLLHKRVFETSGYYEDVDPEELHESFAFQVYRSLAKRIARLEPDESSQLCMAAAINRSWRSGRRFYSHLITNIKSHKPPGEVGVRNIHASSVNKREGLSRWVARELQSPLTGHVWFLTSSAQLVADIRTVIAEDSDYFVKLDVRDFYMTGTPSELTNSIKSLFPVGPRCKLLCEAVEFLLSSEYVVSKLVPGRVFRVVRGSGMGHRHSGCIADCSFFALGKRDFAAKAQVLECFGVKRYYRYRDDVLMICSRKQGTREFFQTLRRMVQPFRIQVEEVNSVCVRYLDLLLTKSGTRFIAQPAFKPTSLARPLDPASAHPKFVHCSWPVGMVKRIFPLCSREVDVLPCKRELISRLQANSASKCTIARVVKANPWPERKVPRVSDNVSSVLWAVFGFHPGLQKELLHAIRRVLGCSSCALVREAWPTFPEIRIAWKNTLPSHHTHVMRCMHIGS